MHPAPKLVVSRSELVASGWTGRSITAEVRSGGLIRIRRDHYSLSTVPPAVLEAVRVGGRITCLSALQVAGVFVFENRRLHVHLETNASRLRSPSLRSPLGRSERNKLRLHWGILREHSGRTESAVSIVDALVHSLQCQPPELAIATVDNALHQSLISPGDLSTIFARAPTAVARLQTHVDGRSESGQESIIRLLLVREGIPFEIQVEIAGVGRVDFLIAGVLVLEADSRLAHDGWDLHRRDRRRDLILATLGYASLRPTYEHTMFEPELVIEAIRCLLRAQCVVE